MLRGWKGRAAAGRWWSVLFLCLVAACGHGTATGADQGDGSATLRVHASVPSAQSATLVLEVTAPDLAAPLVFNVPVVSGSADGSIRIPTGTGRLVTGKVIDSGGVETHRGSTTLAVQPGQNAPLVLELVSLTGDLPVDVSFGSFYVAVSPRADTLAIGASAQLSAVLIDERGDTVAGTFEWFSSDVRVATVNAAGLVLARDTGSVRILAGRSGAAAAALLRVTAVPR